MGGGRTGGQEGTRGFMREKQFFVDNLLVRNHFIIVMIMWNGFAPWKFEVPCPGDLASTPTWGKGQAEEDGGGRKRG